MWLEMEGVHPDRLEACLSVARRAIDCAGHGAVLPKHVDQVVEDAFAQGLPVERVAEVQRDAEQLLEYQRFLEKLTDV